MRAQECNAGGRGEATVSRAWRAALATAVAGSMLVSCYQHRAAASHPAAVTHSPGHQVQVVAHPDDDILFMNPDLAAAVRNGRSTSIYLTGGESDLPNPTDYAARRQDGTRAAYARMAGVPDTWTRRTVPVTGNRLVEIDELAARPDVRLAFLNLPEDNNPAAAGGKHSLSRLWARPADAVCTLVQNGAAVRDSYCYRRADVVDALDALFERLRPSVIRAQDPQPDSRYQPDWGDFHDHPDHVSSARFTREAALRYLARPDHRAAIVHYRDYNVADAPIDLSLSDQQAKRDYFSTYLEHDFAANLQGAYQDWVARGYRRFSHGSAWAGIDGLGHVHAFAVSGTRLLHWERAANMVWRPPVVITLGNDVRPALTVVVDHRGRLILVAQSWDGSQVIVTRQTEPGGRWPAAGTVIAGPPGGDPSQTGTPTATVDRRGRLVLFVKSPRGTVSMRRETSPGGGDWEAWADLGGSDVQDGLTVVHGQGDHLHLFAATRDRVLHWHEQADGALRSAPTPLRKIQATGAPGAARAPGGTTVVVARTGDNGTFAAVSVEPVLGWERPSRLPNPGGTGTPVVIARHGPTGPETLIFAHNSDGGVSAYRPGGPWTDLGGNIVDQPAAVVEPDGAVTLLAISDDGSLQWNREVLESPNLALHRVVFHGWRRAFPG
jgi:LmbE family N-acetylglucosaminyl deacetylase